MSVKLDPMTIVAEENSLQTLSYLDSNDLAQCCKVSKTWNRLASDDSLWKHLFQGIEMPSNVGLKKYLDTHAVTSKEDVLKRIQEFADKLKLNQKGSFTCFFPFNPECKISIELGYVQVKNGSEETSTLKEVCVFIRTIPNDMGYNSTFFGEDNPTTHVPGTSFFNLTIIPGMVKRGLAKYKVVLPATSDIKNFKYSEQINKVLNTRVKSLKIQDQVQTQRRNYIYGITATAVVVVGGIALYLRSSKSDDQSNQQ